MNYKLSGNKIFHEGKIVADYDNDCDYCDKLLESIQSIDDIEEILALQAIISERLRNKYDV